MYGHMDRYTRAQTSVCLYSSFNSGAAMCFPCCLRHCCCLWISEDNFTYTGTYTHTQHTCICIFCLAQRPMSTHMHAREDLDRVSLSRSPSLRCVSLAHLCLSAAHARTHATKRKTEKERRQRGGRLTRVLQRGREEQAISGMQNTWNKKRAGKIHNDGEDQATTVHQQAKEAITPSPPSLCMRACVCVCARARMRFWPHECEGREEATRGDSGSKGAEK